VKYLTPAEIAAELPRISYKPGWTITCHEQPYDGFPYEGFCLDISFSVPNAYPRTEVVDGLTVLVRDKQVQNVHVPVPPIVNAQHLHDFIMWRLARIETHEMREFYWVDGKIVDNPHALVGRTFA
jgi:hypothetical protein